jgi:alpha-amylase/alpha-mannosidase (GH57 family)
MHQPFYKDLAGGAYAMPWVRLHALKDYYGMVAILREFPNVHATFNLVPSLLLQLEDYASGQAREEPYDLAFRPADSLNLSERAALLQYSFQINFENMLSRYPRFQELYDKMHGAGSAAAARMMSEQDFIDLQVLSQLAWFDEIYLADDEFIHGLVVKGRGYAEEDKAELRNKEIELCKVTLEEYRKAAELGQIEISTSPLYHPILPLLCDNNVASESHPGVRLPRRRFQHPEDARQQLREAVAVQERLLGFRPAGLWPSEGSVSNEVLLIAAEEGFRWAATDEGVLARSLRTGFHRHSDGTLADGLELYRPHQLAAGGNEISLFFRDHQLSDLVGFVYSHMDPYDAARDLHARIRNAARTVPGGGAVISIILDGENAWEYYRGNGREFLKSFYSHLNSDPELRAVTASEALIEAEQGRLDHVVPGSWINANFDVWIGAEEDNQAWDLLSSAREFFEQHGSDPGLDPAKLGLAQQEVWIAEGSDWCWWYGPEHSSAHDAQFDLLYRTHLSNIYRLLGGSPPDALALPIKSPELTAVSVAPTGSIHAQIDGRVTNYFEWIGAGVYVPDYRSGSMHGGSDYVDALYYGFSDAALFLRLDFPPSFTADLAQFEIRVNVDGESRVQFRALVREGELRQIDFLLRGEPMLVPLATGDKVQAAFSEIFELGLAYDLLNLHPHERTNIQVSLWANDLPLQLLPQEGWLTMELTDELVSW